MRKIWFLFLFIPLSVLAETTDFSEGWTLGGGISYPAYQLQTFANGRTSTGQNVFAEFQYAAQVTPWVEVRFTKKKRIGYFGALSIELKNSINGGSVTTAGTKVVLGSSGNASIGFTTLQGGGLYRFDDSYIFGGATLSIPQYSPPATWTGGSTNYGIGYGYEWGAGYYLNNHIVLDFTYRTLGMTLSTTPTSGVATDYGTGSLVQMLLGLKWFL